MTWIKLEQDCEDAEGNNSLLRSLHACKSMAEYTAGTK